MQQLMLPMLQLFDLNYYELAFEIFQMTATNDIFFKNNSLPIVC